MGLQVTHVMGFLTAKFELVTTSILDLDGQVWDSQTDTQMTAIKTLCPHVMEVWHNNSSSSSNTSCNNNI